MKKLRLNENFICRIWEDKTCYDGLKTSKDESLEIIDYGIRNYDSGPDYKNACIRVANAVYSGSIEIHRSIDDWYLHNHDGDNKYNDLILHVVFYDEDDFEDKSKSIKVKKARNIPTVILSNFLTESIHDIWKRIIDNPSPKFRLPCFPQNRNVCDEVRSGWLRTLSIDRLNFRSERFQSRLMEITDYPSKKIYWEQALFEFICEALGFSKNKEQFLKLSKRIELHALKKMDPDRFACDSTLFGLSGFLAGVRFKDDYISLIKEHWNKLKDDLQKEMMDRAEWHFFRLRPANFPTLRLAYASSLLYEILYNDLLRDIVRIFEESDDVTKGLERRFMEIEVSEYWRTHYDFGKEGKLSFRTIGSERVKDILTNVLLPLVYSYSLTFEKAGLKNRIEYFYKKEKQKSGSNEVTRVMEQQINVKISSIADEQALMQLHNNYCIMGRCSECDIGKIVFANDQVHEPLRIILY